MVDKLTQTTTLMSNTLQQAKVRKELFTTLPLTSVILPYFGYADECQILMTQLRRASRKLWDKNKHILLRNYPGEDGEDTLLIQKKLLKIDTAYHGHFLHKKNTLSFESFMESELSKLYKLQIYRCCSQESIIRELFKFFREVDTNCWTIEKIEIKFSRNAFRKASPEYMLSSLHELAKFLKTQFVVHENEYGDLNCISRSKIIYRGSANRHLTLYKDTHFPNSNIVSAFWEEYSKLYDQLTDEGVEAKKFLTHLETNTIDQVCEKAKTSAFKLKLFSMNNINDIVALKGISDKLKGWHRDHQEQIRRLKTIYLRLFQFKYDRSIDNRNCLLNGLITLSRSCKESGLNLIINTARLEDWDKTSASLCYLVIGYQALVIEKFECCLYGRPFVDKNFIASDKLNIDFNGCVTDVVSFYDTGLEDLLEMEGKIIIPVNKILQTRFKFGQLCLNEIKSLPWKLTTMSFYFSIENGLIRDAIRKIKALPEDIKIDFYFEGYYCDFLSREEKSNFNIFLKILKTKKLAALTIQKIYNPGFELEDLIDLLHNQTNLELLEFNIMRSRRPGPMINSIKKLFTALETLPNLKSIDICITFLYKCEIETFETLAKKFISRSIGISIRIKFKSEKYLDRYSKLKYVLK
ncbi:unnamed protein product [Moneuplotes crassus]|uniref:Uncharacterized protein n=1 Tax=Euplotes crassus TaxID=5936 RepID=A0AAD2DAV4_EUPCR|nr:unnamed protein product [Moneuplotes crassus]